jgi:hypothetical protein
MKNLYFLISPLMKRVLFSADKQSYDRVFGLSLNLPFANLSRPAIETERICDCWQLFFIHLYHQTFFSCDGVQHVYSGLLDLCHNSRKRYQWISACVEPYNEHNADCRDHLDKGIENHRIGFAINCVEFLVEGTEHSEGRKKLQVRPILGRIINLELLLLSDVIL